MIQKIKKRTRKGEEKKKKRGGLRGQVDIEMRKKKGTGIGEKKTKIDLIDIERKEMKIETDIDQVNIEMMKIAMTEKMKTKIRKKIDVDQTDLDVGKIEMMRKRKRKEEV